MCLRMVPAVCACAQTAFHLCGLFDVLDWLPSKFGMNGNCLFWSAVSCLRISGDPQPARGRHEVACTCEVPRKAKQGDAETPCPCSRLRERMRSCLWPQTMSEAHVQCAFAVSQHAIDAGPACPGVPAEPVQKLPKGPCVIFHRHGKAGWWAL